MKTTKIFFMAALALTFAACSNDDNDLAQQPVEQSANNMITITAKLAPKSGDAQTRAVSESGGTIVVNWAKDETMKIISENGKEATATVKSVDGSGTATIEFSIDAAAVGQNCTIIYPASAAVTESAGVYTAQPMTAQTGTLSNDLDVRIGKGTISDATTLDVTTQPAAQFAIFKFTTQSKPDQSSALQNTSVTKLTVTIGAQDYVITPASATSTLYAALPAVSGQTVSFTATDGSNLYAASKASVSFDAAKYYQSTVKMGKLIEVFGGGEPFIDDFIDDSAQIKYLHIDLDQAYAIASQLSTQNGGATVAVVYNHYGEDATYALSSDNSATARTDGCSYLVNNYRVFLATLWEFAS